jgi:hypothetical protein
MAINFNPDTAASTPCRIFVSFDGTDAAALVVSNTQLLNACAEGPLKDFLSSALTGPSDAAKNLRVNFVPAGVSPNSANPDANIANWAFDLAPDVDNKLTLRVSQDKTPATGGAVFVAYGWIEYIHSLVR